MRNVLKALSSAGSLALVLSGTAMAAPPAGGFDNWSVNATGVVSATTGICAIVGTTCATVVDGAGFLQQEVTMSDGTRYVRTMIAEGFATAGGSLANLTFASEDFVKMGGAAQGLASKMNIKEGVLSATGTAANLIDTGFGAGATILTGWGTNNVLNSAEAVLTLGLSDRGAGAAGVAGGDEFLTSFSVTTNTVAAGGTNVTSALAVDQTIFVGGTTNLTDKQRFVTMVDVATTAQTNFKFATNTTDPATITYAVGDKIQVVWAGQDVTGAGSFSTQSLIKDPNGTTPVAVRASNLTSPNTFEWTAAPATVLNSEFGATPVF
ncbi:MAG: hypothetical protein M3A44_05645 [Gammaproteobacteria bacterium]